MVARPGQSGPKPRQLDAAAQGNAGAVTGTGRLQFISPAEVVACAQVERVDGEHVYSYGHVVQKLLDTFQLFSFGHEII